MTDHSCDPRVPLCPRCSTAPEPAEPEVPSDDLVERLWGLVDDWEVVGRTSPMAGICASELAAALRETR